jgi:hypothetical protein
MLQWGVVSALTYNLQNIMLQWGVVSALTVVSSVMQLLL